MKTASLSCAFQRVGPVSWVLVHSRPISLLGRGGSAATVCQPLAVRRERSSSLCDSPSGGVWTVSQRSASPELEAAAVRVGAAWTHHSCSPWGGVWGAMPFIGGLTRSEARQAGRRVEPWASRSASFGQAAAAGAGERARRRTTVPVREVARRALVCLPAFFMIAFVLLSFALRFQKKGARLPAGGRARYC